jgi:type I restriction enzyme S subunit
MPFDEAVWINPPVRMMKGSIYPFVDMQSIDPNLGKVAASELREFKGGGSRFLAGDTLMARITPCLENGKIARFASSINNQVGHGSTEFIVIRGRPNVTDNDFAYYLTRSEIVRKYAISQMTGTSGRQRVPTTSLKHLSVFVPSLPEQKAIAEMLAVFDDKIELDRQMNRTLEAMARAIFKSWFVDFDPVHAKAEGRQPIGIDSATAALFPDSFEDSELGKIPKGWKAGHLCDVCSPQGGFAFRSRDFSAIGYPVIKIKSITTDKDVNINQLDCVSSDIANQAKDYWLNDGDLIMAMTGATVGKFGLVLNPEKAPCLLNQRVARLRSFTKHDGKVWFTYCVLSEDEIINQVISIADGSAQPNISADGIASAKLVSCPRNIFTKSLDLLQD